MKKTFVLLLVMLILLVSPVVEVQASNNPGNYDPGVGHEMCPPHKNCYHNGW